MTSPIAAALARLRTQDAATQAGLPDGGLRDGLRTVEVGFAAVGGPLEDRWVQALRELQTCIGPVLHHGPILREGGPYDGAWLESTATINAELLDRFAPSVTRTTHLALAEHQRADGLLPYKVTADGPAYLQIQMVTPLARCVWHHYLLTGRDRGYLRTMHDAMVRFDAWLAEHRDTRGTGGVEAFCTFDTGHDASPRFWFAPDRCLHGDATRYDPHAGLVPYVAPDLTANVACQRAYLARIAEELGQDAAPWRERSAASLAALAEQCRDDADGFWYDRDATGAHVRVQSDVLLRVLACEVGDAATFQDALERYLMDTRKFLAHHGFTSLAMDDPRFDHDAGRNSWGGPVNFLTLVRAPHAFEHHGRVAELALATTPVLAAVARADRFPQCLDPWSGDAGFTSAYSPAILWFLDTVERLAGVLPRPDGQVWLSGLPPTRLGHGTAASATAYARRVAGVRWELAADDDRVEVYRDGRRHLAFPRGWRVRLDADGEVRAVVGLATAPVAGVLEVGADVALPLTLAGNEVAEVDGTQVRGVGGPGVVLPRL